MAATAAAFGLKPVNLIGGRVYAGSTRQIKIASGFGTNIFNGDVVKLVAGGTVEKDTGTTALTPVGVFVGCKFTDPNSEQMTFKNHCCGRSGCSLPHPSGWCRCSNGTWIELCCCSRLWLDRDWCVGC